VSFAVLYLRMLVARVNFRPKPASATKIETQTATGSKGNSELLLQPVRGRKDLWMLPYRDSAASMC